MKPPCKLLDSDTERSIRFAKQAQRDPLFRSKVLEMDDNKCVISEDDQPEGLDAAHINEVHRKGLDEVTNGITLRKDLHALYDAGLFSITSEGNFIPAEGLVDRYRNLLEGRVLPKKTLDRVRGALQEREKNADKS